MRRARRGSLDGPKKRRQRPARLSREPRAGRITRSVRQRHWRSKLNSIINKIIITDVSLFIFATLWRLLWFNGKFRFRDFHEDGYRFFFFFNNQGYSFLVRLAGPFIFGLKLECFIMCGKYADLPSFGFFKHWFFFSLRVARSVKQRQLMELKNCNWETFLFSFFVI